MADPTTNSFVGDPHQPGMDNPRDLLADRKRKTKSQHNSYRIRKRQSGTDDMDFANEELEVAANGNPKQYYYGQPALPAMAEEPQPPSNRVMKEDSLSNMFPLLNSLPMDTNPGGGPPRANSRRLSAFSSQMSLGSMGNILASAATASKPRPSNAPRSNLQAAPLSRADSLSVIQSILNSEDGMSRQASSGNPHHDLGAASQGLSTKSLLSSSLNVWLESDASKAGVNPDHHHQSNNTANSNNNNNEDLHELANHIVYETATMDIDNLIGTDKARRLNGVGTSSNKLDLMGGSLKLDGLGTSMKLDGLGTSVKLDGFGASVKMEGLGGSMKLDGLGTSLKLGDPVGGMGHPQMGFGGINPAYPMFGKQLSFGMPVGADHQHHAVAGDMGTGMPPGLTKMNSLDVVQNLLGDQGNARNKTLDDITTLWGGLDDDATSMNRTAPIRGSVRKMTVPGVSAAVVKVEGGNHGGSGKQLYGGSYPEKQRHQWSPQEDEALQKAVEKHGTSNWRTISNFVPGRSNIQCRARWGRVLQPGLRKGYWSQEEDALLLSLVKDSLERNNGEVNWAEIKDQVEGRSIKQCRERWAKNLDPNLKKGSWTPEEDKLIIEQQAEIGNRWALISRMLDGRTEHSVKTRWRSLMRGKKRVWTKEQDAQLLELQKRFKNRWDKIAEFFDNRTKNAVMTRYKALAQEQKQLNETSTNPAQML